MSNRFRVAVIQNCAEREMAPSIAAIEPLIRAAAKDGADLIQLPEMATMIEPDNEAVLRKTVSEAEDPGLAAFRRRAAQRGPGSQVG